MHLEVDSRMLVSGKDYIIHASILGEIRAVKDYNYMYLIASTAKYNFFKKFIEV